MQLFRERTLAWMHSLVISKQTAPVLSTQAPKHKMTTWHLANCNCFHSDLTSCHELHLLCPHAKPEFPAPCTSWGTSFQKVLSEAGSPATPLTWGWQKVSLLDLHLQSGMIKDHQGSFQCVCVCARARARRKCLFWLGSFRFQHLVHRSLW